MIHLLLQSKSLILEYYNQYALNSDECYFYRSLSRTIIDKQRFGNENIYSILEKYEALKKLELDEYKLQLTKFRQVLNLKKDGIQVKLLFICLECEIIALKGEQHLRCPSINCNDVKTVTHNYYEIGPLTYQNHYFGQIMKKFGIELMYEHFYTTRSISYLYEYEICYESAILGYYINVVTLESENNSELVRNMIDDFRTIDMKREIFNMKKSDWDHEMQKFAEEPNVNFEDFNKFYEDHLNDNNELSIQVRKVSEFAIK